MSPPRSPQIGTPNTPAAEWEITPTLVEQLLASQHPDLATLPLQIVEAGWDNVMYRLGEHWAVRLPRRQLAAPLIEHEQAWLPQLAAHLPLAVPTPVRIGQPTAEYPWHWSVVPWLPGTAADLCPPLGAQPKFATFLRALHQPAPPQAPQNPYRGVPLSVRAEMLAERMQRLTHQTHFITPRLEQLWVEALAAPLDLPHTWLHGDLHPRNVLVNRDRQICGVIDWGDMTAGDPATDLASLWMLFEDTVRQQILAAYGPISEATLQRARGWAIMFGVILLDNGLADTPRHRLMGEQTLQRVLEL